MLLKEALNNSSMNDQNTPNKKCDFCLSSFSMIYNHQNGGTSTSMDGGNACGLSGTTRALYRGNSE
jgi:hypothetical protein